MNRFYTLSTFFKIVLTLITSTLDFLSTYINNPYQQFFLKIKLLDIVSCW